jgi:hypothetical protein
VPAPRNPRLAVVAPQPTEECPGRISRVGFQNPRTQVGTRRRSVHQRFFEDGHARRAKGPSLAFAGLPRRWGAEACAFEKLLDPRGSS